MTIAAIATASGGAIGIIRVSGPDAVKATNAIFSKDIQFAKGYTLHYGNIGDIDSVLVSVFRSPHSYTGEDCVEISCHGSSYILAQVMQTLFDQGVRQALPGEFTQRAFLNGKMDLSQAEAVADLIASNNAATHRVALNQMRGAITNKLADLRSRLLTITSLLELELDFSEEDVEFADRTELTQLSQETLSEIDRLRQSFSSGNAIKNGIPVAIIGAPNVGKSTLLNQLLQDDKAIVSDIQGTTRDLIEDTIILGGYLFRFIDTAGIRDTEDTIERLGIERSLKAANKAQIIILMSEPGVPYPTIETTPEQYVIYVQNKADKEENCPHISTLDYPSTNISISALLGHGIETLQQSLIDHAHLICGDVNEDHVLITNLRHKEALDLSSADMQRVLGALRNSKTGDLIAEDLRLCLNHLSDILGTQITTHEVLANIFKNFCIGK